MNYIRIDKDNLLNGEGIRVVLWVSGCNHCCKGCHNPETWDAKAGQVFNEQSLNDLINHLKPDYIAGLTLSGGDPLFPNNREMITKICKTVKEKLPNKNIWCYTGYTYDEVKDLEVIKYLDVLVDGPYIEKERDVSLHWVGSKNQRIIRIKK